MGTVGMAVVVIRRCRSGKEFAHLVIKSKGGVGVADSTLTGIGVDSELCRAYFARSRASTRVVGAVVRHRRAVSRELKF